MVKATINLDFLEFQKLIDQLSIREKLILAKKLEKETIASRMDNLLRKIDRRRKKHPLAKKEIVKEIMETRKEIYG